MLAVHKDYTAAKLGMWLFLISELLLFGGLFVLYAVYFTEYSKDFNQAGKELSLFFGTFNTLTLLTSSLTVAVSITAFQKGKRNLTLILLIITILLAMVFLVNKYFEWSAKIGHGIYPDSPILLKRVAGEKIFFGLYYMITGLHGIHVLVGMTLLSLSVYFIIKNKISQNDFVWLENTGLYWHLVDLIWIFIFPLFYLIL